MAGKKVVDPWYEVLERKYGYEFAVEAGYFCEEKTWTTSYLEVFGEEFLKKSKDSQTLIQFSGAFWPFHDGHVEILQKAINYLNTDLLVFVHVDHMEYRNSKGRYDENKALKAFHLLQDIQSEKTVEIRYLFEDKMPDSCSRNFTRLYQELRNVNPQTTVWFLAGGDRASFCLSFKDKGQCLIIGRDQSPSFKKFIDQQNSRIVFIQGNSGHSSTEIRSSYED